MTRAARGASTAAARSWNNGRAVTEEIREQPTAGPEAKGAAAEPAPSGSVVEPEPKGSADLDVETEAEADPALDALWKRVVEAWDDDKPHGAIVEYAVRTQKLPELAGRYKTLVGDPEKGAKAKKRLDGVVTAAMHLLYATKAPKPTKTPWQWTLTVGLICVVVVAWLGYRILVTRLH